MFHGFCSEKRDLGVWRTGVGATLFNRKLALYGEVHIAECFLVGLSYDDQELEQGESGGVSKGFSYWFA